MYNFVWTPFIFCHLLQKMELKMILMLQMTKECAYNQGVLILEYFVQVENQY